MKVEKETKDVILKADKKNSRRSLLKKTIIGVPVVMTLANKPAFGAVCSLSGFQSVNPSGVDRHDRGCGGISPGGWKENGYKTNGDGNRNQWSAAGFDPNPRVLTSTKYKGQHGIYPDDLPGTLFFDPSAFAGATPTITVLATETLHDVLLKGTGTLEFHAIANFLNAHYFGWGNGDGRMPAGDIRGVYLAYTSNAPTYTTSGGTIIDLNNFNLQDFFDQLYH